MTSKQSDEMFVEKCHQLNVLLAVARDLMNELQVLALEHEPPPSSEAQGFAYVFLDGARHYLGEISDKLEHLIGIHYGA